MTARIMDTGTKGDAAPAQAIRFKMKNVTHRHTQVTTGCASEVCSPAFEEWKQVPAYIISESRRGSPATNPVPGIPAFSQMDFYMLPDVPPAGRK